MCQDGSKNFAHVNSLNSHNHSVRGKTQDDSCFYSQGNEDTERLLSELLESSSSGVWTMEI